MAVVSTTVGSIDWIDLSTPNVDQSVEFYSRLFGWQVEASVNPMGTYYVGRIDGRDVAGMMQRGIDVPATVPAMWSVYVRVQSTDAATARAILVGGAVLHDPFDIPGGSRISILADPAGAAFVVMAGEQPSRLLRDTPGALVGCELLTRDVDRARHFYIDMFGWEATVDLASGYITFHHEGREVAGMLAMPVEVPPEAPSHWLPYFGVSDCAESCATVQRLGGTLAMPLRAFEVQDVAVKMAVAEDPMGAMFGLVEHTG